MSQKRKLGKVEGKLILRSIFFMAFITAITFILAGRLDYWQGWIYIGLNIIFLLLPYFLLPPELYRKG